MYELGVGATFTDEQARKKAYELMSKIVSDTMSLYFSFESVMAGEGTTVRDVYKEFRKIDGKLEDVYAILRPF